MILVQRRAIGGRGKKRKRKVEVEWQLEKALRRRTGLIKFREYPAI